MHAWTMAVISNSPSISPGRSIFPEAAIAAPRFRNSLCFFSVARFTRFAEYSLPPIFRVKSAMLAPSMSHLRGDSERVVLGHAQVLDLLVGERIAERHELLDRRDRRRPPLRDEHLAAAEVDRAVGFLLEIVRQRVQHALQDLLDLLVLDAILRDVAPLEQIQDQIVLHGVPALDPRQDVQHPEPVPPGLLERSAVE